MYNTVLLESKSDITNIIKDGSIVQSLIEGIKLSLQVHAAPFMNKTVIPLVTIILALSFDSVNQAYAKIIEKFLRPIDKIIEGWKNNEFVVQNTSSIIIPILNILMFAWGMIIGTTIFKKLFKLKPQKLGFSFNNILFSFLTIIDLLTLLSSISILTAKRPSYSIESLLKSKYKTATLLAKALAIASSKYKQCENPVKVLVVKESRLDYAYVKIGDEPTFLVPDTMLSTFTDDEVIAIFLHEIGHCISVRRTSIPTFLILVLENVISSIHSFFSGLNSAATHLLFMLTDDIRQSINSIRDEQIADAFVYQFGYATDLKHALEKLDRYISQKYTLQSPLKIGFISHPSTKKRINYLDELSKMSDNIEKVTYETLKKELDAEKAKDV
ncbi:MAG: M48 family metalloprotease [Candidatus Micrarchaeaceae archaeon]